MKILIWGTGGHAERWINSHSELFGMIQILAFIDRNREEEFLGKSVIRPIEIKMFEFDYIVIASSFYDEILDEIVNGYKIEKDKILSLKQVYQLWIRSKYQFIEEIPCVSEKKHFFESVITEPKLIEYSDEWVSFEYLKETYKDYIKSIPWTSDGKVTRVWIYWEQGVENAPLLVKKCIESVRKWNADLEVEVISLENIGQYISIPGDILKMHEEGIIGYAHFSDIVRIELLVKYGGIWVDATVFCTDHFPDYIFQNSIFMFQFPKVVPTPRMIANWLIYADKNHSFLRQFRDLLYMYWRNEKRVVNYYLFHLLFHVMIDHYQDEWNRLPVFVNSNCFLMSEEINEAFNEKRYEQLKQCSPIHKLNYKIQMEKKEQMTLYEFILKEYRGL